MNVLKGWIGEKKAAFHLLLSLDKKTYTRFHDLIVPSSNGTAQIDHLLVSRYGLFIVETKNWQGWIFGSANQATWSRTLYGDSDAFQNPLRQTYRQKKVLAEFLSIDDALIRPVIYFVGDCEFKTNLPPNVVCSKAGEYIKTFNSYVLSNQEVGDITRILQSHIRTFRVRARDHRVSLKIRHGSKSRCPNCGGALRMRVAKRGTRAGASFLGCERYPQCRYTRDLSD